jgi:hypothetical protein
MPARGLGINKRKFDRCVKGVSKDNKKRRRAGKKTYNPFAVCTATLRKDRHR